MVLHGCPGDRDIELLVGFPVQDELFDPLLKEPRGFFFIR